jgi:hypothetical protein
MRRFPKPNPTTGLLPFIGCQSQPADANSKSAILHVVSNGTYLLTDHQPVRALFSVCAAVLMIRHADTGPMTSPYADLPWCAAPSVAPDRPDSSDERRLIRAMISLLIRTRPSSDAEALKFLRDGFPNAPLTTRIAALSARFNRRPDTRSSYIPR